MDIEQLRIRHSKICSELKIDPERSWNSYVNTAQVYTLEGDPLHWICCALTYACKTDPPAGEEGGPQAVKVPFKNILEKCGIGLREFFQKIEKWNEMNSVPVAFRSKIEVLKKNFEYTRLLYKKFSDIFQTLIICPTDEKNAPKRKKDKIKCTAKTLFEFCWCLFVQAKAQLKEKDLINFCNFMVCCCDFIYANVIAEKRADLINPEFRGVPRNWNTPLFDPVAISPVCIISELCEQFQISYKDVLTTKNYSWKIMVKKLFETKVLQGDAGNFVGILSTDNFDRNYRSINNIYEKHLLTHDEIDEKLFLVVDDIGVDNYGGRGEGSNQDQQQQNSSPLPFIPPMTPLSTATDSIKKLNDVLSRSTGSPPTSLIAIFENFQRNHQSFVEASIERNRSLFMSRVKSDSSARFDMAVRVFYRLLEDIYNEECRRKKCIVEGIFFDENIMNTLLVCSLEIVFCAYGNPERFPWVLDCFNLSAFGFYRIIEPVVSSQNSLSSPNKLLSHSVVEHLKRIEEQCLDSLVWNKDSPLWIHLRNYSIPKFQECSNSVNLTPKSVMISGGTHLLSPQEYPKRELIEENVPRELMNLEHSSRNGNGEGGEIDTTPIKRNNSLGLYFRKIYVLAHKRLEKLYKDLDFRPHYSLSEVWTIFEHCIVEQVHLFKDRHLDQIIMCSVYVYARVKECTEIQFKLIMQKYRNQIHSSSHVYRNVYLGSVPLNEANDADEKTRQPVPIDECAKQAVNYDNEVRGDIIKFYNEIFVTKVQGFALKFRDNIGGQTQPDVMLSPRPTTAAGSPRKINNNLTVTTKERGEQQPHSFTSPGSFTILQQSPVGLGSMLTAINQNISAAALVQAAPGKRTLNLTAAPDVPTKKIKNLISDRNASQQ